MTTSQPDKALQPEQPHSQHRVPVLVPFPFMESLDYLTPHDSNLQPGDIVDVPLGRKITTGVVWDTHNNLPSFLSYREHVSDCPTSKLRTIQTKRNLPSLSLELRHFIAWVAAYNFAPPGMVMAMALRPFLKGIQKQEKPLMGWKVAPELSNNLKLTPQRKKVLAYLKEHKPTTTQTLCKSLEITSSVLKGLEKSGAIIQAPIERNEPANLPSQQLHYDPPTLNPHQQKAATSLRQTVAQGKFNVTLLEGVTGSGKTETYFEAIQQSIELGKQVLVLLPEIALSSQWKERFKQRFGAYPAIWHSSESEKNKRITWIKVAQGETPVVVGARSALFLPFKNLGCIIVDEEHENLFKQEEGVLYNGRDMAIVRAKYANISIILASATPSLETLMNVKTGRYHHEILPSRHGQAIMPDISVIDMRENVPPRGQFLSPALKEEIGQALEKGEQGMLFLNRRGYAPLTLCRECGFRIRCPYCDTWMVEHKATHTLSCHYCDYTIHQITDCPHCCAKDSLIAIGPGIERITAEAKECFDNANILVMSSDTLTSPAAIAQAVEKITTRQVNLIIGTQVIAKGWHFPYLTRVGIVDADLGLSGADLRCGERTLQLLHQVAGRAGRAQSPGKVILQSYVPDHPVIEAIASGNLEEFLEQESQIRKLGDWPPWGRLAAIILSAPEEKEVDMFAKHIAQTAPSMKGIQILGPAPAPVAFLRGKHRRRILLRTKRSIPTQPIIYRWLNGLKLPRSAKITIDIDPVTFL